MCRNCNCEEKKSNCFDTCCEKTNACDNKYSTSCIFYKLENQSNSRLYSIKAENGTPLNTILEEFDSKLNKSSNPDFTAFKIPYLKGKYNIINIKQFSEAVSTELFKNDNLLKVTKINVDALDIAVTTNTTDIEKIKYPKINDSAAAGFTVNSDIKTVLQKLTDKVGILSVTNINTPSITSIESNTVKFILQGNLNHEIKANVKVSSYNGNVLQVKPDGLYVSPINIPDFTQRLTIAGNQLSISNGNTITLPSPTLILNGSILSIDGSSATVNLSTVLNSTQQSITTNNTASIKIETGGVLGHILSADIQLSQDANNILEKRNNGVYVPKSNAQDILNEINVSASNSPLRTTFCQILTNSCANCFSFYIRNTSATAVEISYINCSGVSTPITIPASNSNNIGQYISGVRKIPGSVMINSSLVITCLGIA